MIVILNAPGKFEKCLARVLAKFNVPVYALGNAVFSYDAGIMPVAYSKKDEIGFINHPGSDIIEAFLSEDTLDRILNHFVTFFDPISDAKEKLKHIYASKINFFLTAQVDFFVRNEIERGGETIIILDTKLSSFMSVPFNLTNKNIYHVYIPFADAVVTLLFICKFFLKKLITYDPFKSFFVNKSTLTQSGALEKKIAVFFHQGQSYGDLYRKDHYYSPDPLSQLHESRIRKLSYNYDQDPDVDLVKPKLTIKDCIKILHAIPIKLFLRSLKLRTFKDLLIITSTYMHYLAWRNVIPALGIRGVIYDYDILFPKALSIALESFEIKTCCLQERPITMFYNYNFGVITDTYVTSGKLFSRYSDVKNKLIFTKNKINHIPWRLKFFNEVSVDLSPTYRDVGSDKVSEAIKVIVFIGYHLDVAGIYPLTCLRANEEFLKYAFSCSKENPNHKIVIRMKMLDPASLAWLSAEVSEYQNITISVDVSNAATYALCKDADVVVSVQSSLVEECIGHGKKIVLIDDLFSVKNVCSGIYPEEFDFMIVRSISAFEQRIASLLADDQFLQDEYSELRRQIVGINPDQSQYAIPKILEKIFS